MQGAGRRLTSRAAVALVAVVAAWFPAASQAAEPRLDARSWLLVDADDEEILAARAPNRQVSVASTAKLMTAYVARKRLRLREKVTAPPYTATAAESLLDLRAGERMRVRDLLIGLLLASGNDAAVALAEAAAGSVPRFVARMNRAARRLGLDDTSWANPIGLDEPGNHSTAADLVELTLELRADPFFRRTFDLPQARLESGAEPRSIVNRNTLVRTHPFVDGVKTGYTASAGYVLIGSATRGGVTLVSAVLGAPSEAARDHETLELLEYGFSLYDRRRVVRHGERLAAAEVRWQDETLPLEAKRSFALTAREDQRLDTKVIGPDEVEGPIARGERMGEVVVSLEGDRVGEVPLVAARAVEEAKFVERFDAAIPGPRATAWVAAIGGLAVLFSVILAARDRRRMRRRGG